MCYINGPAFSNTCSIGQHWYIYDIGHWSHQKMWDNLLPTDRPNSQSFGRYVNRASSWTKLPPNLFMHLIKFHLVGAVSSHILCRMILKSSLFSNITWVELRQQKSKESTGFVWWWRWGILLWLWTGGTKKILATMQSQMARKGQMWPFLGHKQAWQLQTSR